MHCKTVTVMKIKSICEKRTQTARVNKTHIHSFVYTTVMSLSDADNSRIVCKLTLNLAKSVEK